MNKQLIIGGSILLGLLFWPRRAKAGQIMHYQGEQLTQLFQVAARAAALPIEWAADLSLHNIVQHESGGYVGRPNFQFGPYAQVDRAHQWPQVWNAIREGSWRLMLAEPYRSQPADKQSSATGLGQLTASNIKTGKYYPSGLIGIGSALEEAIGVLKYIHERYGQPSTAWEFWQAHHWW